MFLKVVYMVLGLGMSFMAVTGLLIWLEKREGGSAAANGGRRHETLGRLAIGVCAGMPVATAALFWACRLWLHGAPGAYFASGCLFFAVWGLCLLRSVIHPSRHGAVRELVGTAGLLFAAVPLLALPTGGPNVLALLNAGHASVAAVDLACLLIGAVTLWVAVRPPAGRRREGHRRRLDHDRRSAGPDGR